MFIQPGKGFFRTKMKAFIGYLKDVRGELVHVSWPTRKQATGYALIVIGVSLVIAALMGLFDFLFTEAVTDFLI